MTPDERRFKVLEAIAKSPGVTTAELAVKFPVGDPLYGTHKFIATAVAELRQLWLVEDVPRCPTCGAAKTRGRRNGELHLTATGLLVTDPGPAKTAAG